MSATSAAVYQDCPSYWKALYDGDRPPDPGSSAASLGTACHSVLEEWVLKEYYKRDADFFEMEAIWAKVYHEMFDDPERYDEGLEMLKRWYGRQEWHNREVLTAEVKQSFILKTSIGEIPFNYIMDRMDRLPDGSIEVVDYKTIMVPVTAESMKKRIQPRAYALAAKILYPDAPKIWVTYDMLRHDPVGVVFNRDECAATWKYLHALMERIIADDKPIEKVGPNCRYCPRQFFCRALRMNENIGGVMSVGTPEEMADRRAELWYATKAMENMIDQLDTHLLEHMEAEELFEIITEKHSVSAGAKSRRNIDREVVADIVGTDIMARYGTLRMGDIDGLLKGSELDDAQKSRLRHSIRKGYNNPSISVKVLEEEDAP